MPVDSKVASNPAEALKLIFTNGSQDLKLE